MADYSVDQFPKLENVYRVSGSKFNQLSRNTKLNSEQTGESKVVISTPWCSNVWSQPNVLHKLTKGGNSGSEISPKIFAGSGNGTLNDRKLPPQSLISPTPEIGIHSSVGIDTTTLKDHQCKDEGIPKPNCENNEDEFFDSDDDVSLDDTDSDNGEKNHEGCKKSKWFRKFFDILNKLTVEEINSQSKMWHCPACHGGTRAIDWYRGLQPLLNHSKTIKVRRVRLHRVFAETLEEECSRRGAPLIKVGEAYDGLWEGLDKNVKDHEIVWPPMVVIMNTTYEQDENNKWTGMGSQELLGCFSDYAALKARHSYGPQGHRGMSVLIFDASAAGYLESVRLHMHFKEQGRDREAWNRCKNPFVPGGKRPLYGYLASREDLDVFNKHSGGKSKLKFEMRSYQEMVESRIKHINDDGQQLDIFKNMIAKEQIKSKVIADTLCKVSEKLRKTIEENHIVRDRIKESHQQNKEEMDAQEKFFLDQMQIIQQAIAAKEDEFQKLQQAKLDVIWANGDSSVKGDGNHIIENVSSFRKSQDKDVRQFEAERDNILKMHEDKQLVLKKKQWQEQVELVKELEDELTQLMNKYALSQSQTG